MNYWIKYLVNDKSFLVKLFIPGIIFANFIDIASNILNPPGYFNLWVTKITVLILVPSIIIYIKKNFKKLKKLKQMEKEAPEFEKNREYEIRKILEGNADFSTFCYECKWFNSDLKGCRRDPVYERIKEISIKNKKYCLYWEKSLLANIPENDHEHR
ncbi:MAG: hypothetical protein ABFR75_01865 [Acidobacteriota bacterium]